MKINNLELKNFRNHASTFMMFDKINFILGKNNSGKTSVKGALSLSLTGENEWAVAGKNTKDLIKHGETESTVEVEIDNLGTIKRTIKSKGNIVELNSGKVPDKEVEKEILDDFGLSYEPMECVINSSKFLNMKPNEQKDFLFKLSSVNNTLQPQNIIDFMYKPSADAINKVLSSLSGNINIEELDKVYNDFFATRKFEKKGLATLYAKAQSMGAVSQNSGIDIALVLQQLQENGTKRETVLKSIAVIDEKAKQKRIFEGYIQEKSDKIGKLKVKVNPAIDTTDADDKIFGFVTEINELRKEAEKYRTTERVLESQNKSLANMLSKLSTNVCPLSDKLICKTDKTFLTGELQGQIDKNNKDSEKAKKALDKVNIKLESKKDSKIKLEEQVKISDEIETLQENVTTLKNDVAAIVIEDRSILSAELNNYDTEKKALEESKNIHTEWEKKQKDYFNLSAQIKKSEEEVNLYEYLVKEFSPKGIKTRMLQKIITPIETYCNDRLSILTAKIYKLEFDLSNGFDILVHNKSGIVNLHSLSNSEKLRIGIIFQDAINSLTNAKMLFIDDAEILDQDNTKLLLELLDKIKDNYDTMFVIATSGDKNYGATLKKIANSKVFYTEDGVVSEL